MYFVQVMRVGTSIDYKADRVLWLRHLSYYCVTWPLLYGAMCYGTAKIQTVFKIAFMKSGFIFSSHVTVCLRRPFHVCKTRN